MIKPIEMKMINCLDIFLKQSSFLNVDFTKEKTLANVWQKIRHLILPSKLKAKIVGQNSANLCAICRTPFANKGVKFCAQEICAKMFGEIDPWLSKKKKLQK
jgi:hypothetical protein